MSEVFTLYVLAGCALALVAYPVVSYIRGNDDKVGLCVSLSIPVLVVLAMYAGSASAQSVPGLTLLKPVGVVGPYSTYFPAGQSGYVVTKPTTSAASGVSGSGGAVNVGKAGTAVITRPNLPNISVPVNVSTKVTGAAAAAAAARAATIARALTGPVGAALVGYDIYKRIQESGVTTCPPPAFFCQPEKVAYDRTQAGWGPTSGGSTWTWTLNQWIANRRSACPTAVSDEVEDKGTLNGLPYVYVRVRRADGTEITSCSNGMTFKGGEVTATRTPGPPLTDTEVGTAVGNHVAGDSTGARAKSMYDAAMDADVKMRAAGQEGVPQTVMQPSGSPSTLTSSPVTAPAETISTRTGTDANGNPQTTVTTAQPTVTPVVQGTGSSTTVTYNITYNITNTTTNPADPAVPPKTQTEVIVIRIEPDQAVRNPTEPTEFPKDYNKEATQLQILDVLKGQGVPDGTALSSTDAETSIKGAQGQLTAAVDQVTPGSLGLASWLPSIPTTACVNPSVPNPTNGVMTDIEICQPVNLFSKFISAVICVFVLYGCVREVQAAIKS